MFKFYFSVVILLVFSSANFAQTNSQNNVDAVVKLENIEQNLNEITKAVTDLNLILKNFSQTFSSNQGLRLSERQQKILAAFEFLNRAEQRLATLQKLKIDLTEKQAMINLQIAQIDDDLRPESIDRYVALRGTTNAEEIREIRRQALRRERNELQRLSGEISRQISETDYEIQETHLFLRRLRGRIFPEIEKELDDL